MPRIVAIHQLHYLPWLRYFEKIARSDVFIVLDDVQFVNNDWHHRNKIKTPKGEQILTIPVLHKHGQKLHDVQICNTERWQDVHWKALKQNYARCEHWESFGMGMQEFYRKREFARLNEINREMLLWFLDAMQMRTEIRFASEMPPVPGEASERLVNLVKAVDGDTYYSGEFAIQKYLDKPLFAKAGIRLAAQKWEAPTYTQRYLNQFGFLKDLSIVDLLINEGDRGMEILLSGAPDPRKT